MAGELHMHSPGQDFFFRTQEPFDEILFYWTEFSYILKLKCPPLIAMEHAQNSPCFGTDPYHQDL